MTNRLIRRPEVERLTGLPRSSLYRAIELGEFPRPVRLTGRTVAWPEVEVINWVEAKIAEARGEDQAA